MEMSIALLICGVGWGSSSPVQSRWCKALICVPSSGQVWKKPVDTLCDPLYTQARVKLSACGLRWISV
jgi:hypothetical protein